MLRSLLIRTKSMMMRIGIFWRKHPQKGCQESLESPTRMYLPPREQKCNKGCLSKPMSTSPSDFLSAPIMALKNQSTIDLWYTLHSPKKCYDMSHALLLSQIVPSVLGSAQFVSTARHGTCHKAEAPLTSRNHLITTL